MKIITTVIFAALNLLLSVSSQDNSAVIRADLRKEIEASLPGFISERAVLVAPLSSPDEVRETLPMADLAITDKYDVLSVSVIHRLAIEWGDAVEVNAVLCDRVALASLKQSLFDQLKQMKFQPANWWNGPGFLGASKDAYADLFPRPPEYERIKLLLKLDGRPGDLTQFITLIYEVRAGPRQSDQDKWSDRTKDPAVERYISGVRLQLHDVALQTIAQHCAKVNSSRERSESAAIQAIERQLTGTQRKDLHDGLTRKHEQ